MAQILVVEALEARKDRRKLITQEIINSLQNLNSSQILEVIKAGLEKLEEQMPDKLPPIERIEHSNPEALARESLIPIERVIEIQKGQMPTNAEFIKLARALDMEADELKGVFRALRKSRK